MKCLGRDHGADGDIPQGGRKFWDFLKSKCESDQRNPPFEAFQEPVVGTAAAAEAVSRRIKRNPRHDDEADLSRGDKVHSPPPRFQNAELSGGKIFLEIKNFGGPDPFSLKRRHHDPFPEPKCFPDHAVRVHLVGQRHIKHDRAGAPEFSPLKEPLFNAATFLEPCFTTLLLQTLKE